MCCALLTVSAWNPQASEAALRMHLTEFTTHDILHTRAGPYGQQVYWCRFKRETLQALHAASP